MDLESIIEMVLWSWRLVGWETDGRGRKVTLYTLGLEINVRFGFLGNNALLHFKALRVLEESPSTCVS